MRRPTLSIVVVTLLLLVRDRVMLPHIPRDWLRGSGLASAGVDGTLMGPLLLCAHVYAWRSSKAAQGACSAREDHVRVFTTYGAIDQCVKES
jgi:hypothetical protein